jgi:hypothetical protein
MLSNPKDPFLKAGPEADHNLFKAFSACCDGFPTDSVINAAINILINAVRQQCKTRQQAEIVFDEMLGRAKAILLDRHYDSVGRRKGIFPYHQVIEMDLFQSQAKF